MAHQWFKTSYPGVRYRKHPTRKHGVSLDRYFTIRYQREGKRQEEALGWASQGWSAEKANARLSDLKEAARIGSGATSLREKRQVEADRREEEQKIKAEQQRAETTFCQFFEEKYFPQAQHDKSAGSWRAEDRLYRLWIKPVIGDLPFNEISIEHLNQIKRNMAAGKRAETKPHPRDRKKEAKDAQKKRNPARPMSPKSINYAMAVIRQTWNYACSVKPPLAFGA